MGDINDKVGSCGVGMNNDAWEDNDKVDGIITVRRKGWAGLPLAEAWSNLKLIGSRENNPEELERSILTYHQQPFLVYSLYQDQDQVRVLSSHAPRSPILRITRLVIICIFKLERLRSALLGD